MHGLVLVELQKYLVAQMGDEGWSRLLADTSIQTKAYELVESYPDEEALDLLEAASRVSGMSNTDLLYGFGESIAPSLMNLYKVLIQPEWKTLDLIEEVETTIHQVVRFRNPEARPPEIHCERRSEREIVIRYASPRQLCALVVGIARGVASSYGEEIEIRETHCVSRGDPKCLISVKELRGASAGEHAVDPHAPTLSHAPGTIDASDETLAVTETQLGSSDAPKPPRRRGAEDVAPIEALPGERCGRYELISEIGRGAMGVVYRAHDPVLDRTVALKILLGTYGEESVERFNQEARSVARLRHPGIIPVYDLGNHRGRPYFVMELLEGVTFREWRVGRDTSQVVGILSEVALALDFAHQQGIVHRDVKCENIMMNPDGRPILMDFGVARDISASDPLHEVGVVIGTPAYMSPEQLEATPGLIGPATDVYAIGSVLYYCLCGCPVFEADSHAELFRKVLVEPPLRPRKRNSKISRRLESIIMRCLEKRSQDRYPTAALLAQELKAHAGN